MHYIIGIDPGLNGAIAILTKTGELVEVWDMPTVEVKVGKSVKRRVSPELLTNELRGKWEMVDAAWVEQVASSPQMGVSSAFSFGESFGIVKGVLAAMHIPCHMVLPAKWKRDLKLNASKDGSRSKAIQMWPAHALEFKRAKDDGRAEACLIAHWGLRFSQ
jgi:crossover junction endodeoxyribonuclease RuvC